MDKSAAANCCESTANPEMEISHISRLPPEILHYILSQAELSFGDLLHCREVNSAWKSAVTVAVRKRCATFPVPSDTPSNHRIVAMDDLRECVEEANLEEFPVTKFHFILNSSNPWIQLLGGSAFIYRLFMQISPIVNELSLDFRLGSPQLPRICLALRQNIPLPKLKQLHLKVVSDGDGTDKNKSPTPTSKGQDDTAILDFIKRLLGNSTTLENISLEFREEIQHSDTISRCIQETGIQSQMKLLTSLTTYVYQKPDLEALTNLGTPLKLKNLHVIFGTSSLDTVTFKVFLQSQADSLISLKLTYIQVAFSYNSRISLEFPTLPKLRQLTLAPGHWFTITGARQFLFRNVFYNTFPVLRELCLRKAGSSISDFIGNWMTPLLCLEVLSLPIFHLKAKDTATEICRLFPNVKKLQLDYNLGKSYIGVFYQKMTEIEELCISVKFSCVDCIITGLRESALCKIKQNSSRESWIKALAQRPSTNTMADLHDLKTLKIDRNNENWTGGEEFTEISGVVLKQMKKLERIDFGVRRCGPTIGSALRQDLESHGIKIVQQQPRHRRSRTDDIEFQSYSDISDSTTDESDDDMIW